MQPLLVIDTCGGSGYVGLFDLLAPNQAIAEQRLPPRATQEQLLPAVQGALQHGRCALADLIAVAVVSGPGSFTGVRIGLATAKGLCEARDLPLLTLSRLAALLRAAQSDGANRGELHAWLDAGRGGVYARLWRDGAVVEEGLITEGEAETRSSSGTVAVYEEALRERFAAARLIDSSQFESALRSEAAEAAQRGVWADVALADALYLRVPDAELSLRARQQA